MSVKEGGRDWDTEEDGGGGLGEKWEEGHALQASKRARVIVRYIVITRESEGEDERTSRMPLLVCVCVCVCVCGLKEQKESQTCGMERRRRRYISISVHDAHLHSEHIVVVVAGTRRRHATCSARSYERESSPTAEG